MRTLCDMRERRLKKLSFIAFTLLYLVLGPPLFAQAQSDIGGIWKGHVTAQMAKIDYQIEIEQTKPTVVGRASVRMPTDADWSIYRIEGRFSAGTLSFSGTDWISKQNPNFCLGSLALSLETDGNFRFLKGNWGYNPVEGGCPKGFGGVAFVAQKSTTPAIAETIVPQKAPPSQDAEANDPYGMPTKKAILADVFDSCFQVGIESLRPYCNCVSDIARGEFSHLNKLQLLLLNVYSQIPRSPISFAQGEIAISRKYLDNYHIKSHQLVVARNAMRDIEIQCAGFYPKTQ